MLKTREETLEAAAYIPESYEANLLIKYRSDS